MGDPIQIKAYDAGATVNPFRIVKFSSTDRLVIQAAAASDALIGVSGALIATTADRCDVVRLGLADLEYGGVVTRGQFLTSDSVGRGIAASAGETTIGRAEVSGVSGDIGMVMVQPSGSIAADAEMTTDIVVTTGQLLALNAVPKTLLAAPGAGKAIILLDAILFYDYNSAAYAGIAGGEDLEIRHTDGSGQLFATIETTGFLDQTSDQVRHIFPLAAAQSTPVADAALILCLASGEITTGNSPLKVRVHYKVIDTAW